ncbi:hypothetical protein N180_12030 [Pedobacter antarcticus 4BY]|uniref:Uncharacterized protein n=2 Tax=Pedobacter antarcticus TaxID=34086 RepID=A0A081PM66_9SPHI|nr:hypothetical protein [Pedobacter antarcticus]KEQ31789.1 hypothetical protein N180_12030 [Pedobacter antarcticus 4BY]SFE72643.1 hypothetical protein SAMN03003324_01232 [Pedobacter antarcticus]
MKITLFTIAVSLLLLFKNAHAQHVFLSDNYGKPVVEHKYENLNGSTYLFDNWEPGIVKLGNGSVLKDIELKFDMVNEVVLFKGKNGETLRFVEDVKEFTFLTPQNHKIFRSGFGLVKGATGDTYYEILFDGTIKLLKRTKKLIIESKGYNSATVNKNVDSLVKYYYVNENGKIEEFKTAKKPIISLLSSRAKEIENLIAAEHLDLKNDIDLAKIFKYYNSTL